MGHRDVTIRMAKNDDGDAVAELMRKNDFFQWDGFEIDWSDLEPNWMVAEDCGKIIGCIQVVPAKPIGRIEILSVDPSLKFIHRGIVVKKLVEHATAIIWMFGSQAVSSMIPYELESYFECAADRGWIPISEGHMVFRGLRQ